jgi:hexosaminidase
MNTPSSTSNISSTLQSLIPLPLFVQPNEGQFVLNQKSVVKIKIQPDSAELKKVAHFLADKLAPATGFGLAVEGAGSPGTGDIYLTTLGADASLGDEGYMLTVTPERITIKASQPAGLFYGVQTLRQLLPPAIESPTLQSQTWSVPCCVVRDQPRFGWRGAMLDTGRHFFSAADVKRYIDLAASYKMNRFHLHLSDDQGWRVEIKAYPNLAKYGGSTSVNGDGGGYYTQVEYADLVAYAAERFITLIPEIDMPSHVNAALASIPELNPDQKAPALYEGTEVGFSQLMVNNEFTYTFIADVFKELAALTPGAYLHIGGDEVRTIEKKDYIHFIERVEKIVRGLGKTMIGWEEAAQASGDADTIYQHWIPVEGEKPELVGRKLILSPASKIYLDMQYDENCPLGLHWAARVEVADSYNWDPTMLQLGVREEDMLGVEACLWSETIRTIKDLEFMVFPRLPGAAEIGWTAKAQRNWEDYRMRLAAHSKRMDAMQINYYHSAQIPWEK